MLNFNDTALMKLQLYNKSQEEKSKPSVEQMKFFNSRYNKNDLSSYIVVNKNQENPKIKIMIMIKNINYLKKSNYIL